MTYQLGIDVSKWDNRPLNFQEYNWPFIYVKCGEGFNSDRMFAAHWQAAKGHTLRGAYHYFRPSVDAKKSAGICANILMDDMGELPVALDMETTDGLPPLTVLDKAKSWLSWFEDFTGKRPLIYSGIPFLTLIGARGKDWLKHYDFWFAAYPYDNLPEAERAIKVKSLIDGQGVVFPKVDLFPPLKLNIWQFTGKAKPEFIPGYSCDKLAVDVNFARPEWLSQFGQVSPPAENKTTALFMNYGNTVAEYREAK